MKKLIIITLMTINLTAVDFGNGVNIAGKWNINTGSSLPITEFLSSMNNKWLVDFRTDGYVYDIGSTQKLASWKYKTDDKGVIHIKQLKSQYKADWLKPGDPGYDFFYNQNNQFLKIVKEINSQNGQNCYLVNIINQNQNLYMCKIKNLKEVKETNQEKISIQIK